MVKAVPIPRGHQGKVWKCPDCGANSPDRDVQEEAFYEVFGCLENNSDWVRVGDSTIDAGLCPSCDCWFDVDDFTIVYPEWECSLCETPYEDREDADECCR